MHAVKVDSGKRIRLSVLTPGDLYEPEIGQNVITLRKVPPPKRRWTKTEVAHAIKASPLKFSRSWEQMQKDTREP